ncbi:putative C-S lyase [Paenibacillus athensensis]|uniref:cysteine-S-conjugate beta-lyase n=1 Tax=Paenibacillus athensensis TaxID=1967502 RepID=A0A4Y8Q3T8_9BACL|nr:PatB family C-S lyase [Paenibacillus athensensis]MCD1258349.1 putative C-S lyase [Paenibacillus athensensis]
MFDFDRKLEPPGSGGLKWDYAAAKYGAPDLLAMWVAEMDFPAPPAVLEAIRHRAESGVFGYTFSDNAYTSAIVDWLARRHGWAIKPDWLAHAPGVVPALHYCVQAFTQPGDQVLIPTPVYPPFKEVVERNDRRLVCHELTADENGRYRMNMDELERQLAGGVKLLLLCSPHNPVGRVWTPDELEAVGRLAEAYGVIVASDEIHADLVFAPHTHTPFARLSETLAARTVVCISPSKAFNLAGLQSASVVIADRKLRLAYRQAVQRAFIGAPNTFALVATTAAYREGEAWLDACLAYIRGNIALLRSWVDERFPQLRFAEPEGTYLVWLDCRKLGLSNAELHEFFVQRARIAVNFGDTFVAGGDGFVRLNLACPRAVLEEALERLEAALRA